MSNRNYPVVRRGQPPIQYQYEEPEVIDADWAEPINHYPRSHYEDHQAYQLAQQYAQRQRRGPGRPPKQGYPADPYGGQYTPRRVRYKRVETVEYGYQPTWGGQLFKVAFIIVLSALIFRGCWAEVGSALTNVQFTPAHVSR